MMLCRIALVALLGVSTDALRLDAAVATRRGVLAKAATMAPLLAALPALAEGNQQGKSTDDDGATYYAKSLTGSPGNAAGLSARKGGAIPFARFAGTWSDPAHPGCTRKIQLSSDKAYIKGADEDGKPWKAVGTIDGPTLTIDFSGKGGPKDVVATFVIGKGIVFPDGNVWSRIS